MRLLVKLRGQLICVDIELSRGRKLVVGCGIVLMAADVGHCYGQGMMMEEMMERS